MNTKTVVLWLVVGAFFLGCATVRDELLGQRLHGTWYLDGARDKRCEIVSTAGGLEARNERGQTSKLVHDSFGYVRAVDWDLRGEIRRDSILWANGTTWTRVPSR